MPNSDINHYPKAGTQDIDLLTLRALNLVTIYAGISHDLNGHLNAIVVNAELLKQLLVNSSKNATYTEALLNKTQQLNALIKQLINQLAPISKQWEVVDLSDLIGEILTLISTHIRHQQVKLEIVKPEASVKVYAVSAELQQSILFLIIEALDHLSIRDMLHLELSKVEKKSELQIRSHFSSPFKLTPNNEAPSKIGSQIARKIIKDHNGIIKTHNPSENVLIVQISLPAVE